MNDRTVDLWGNTLCLLLVIPGLQLFYPFLFSRTTLDSHPPANSHHHLIHHCLTSGELSAEAGG